ncbi:glycosyltransferase family 2 protein [Billgrantia diversa]|uniref:glycosyltransferase family 2 protein n=1 Tax=Halomonas sp. MCCC 1A13316 TaxID=2733487 RepID=UPI0018A504B2|nr:glycosyltransferase family 2 protein [Halomonas sp. MCCC 1A13316]QOR39297.1 glycosyltransferase family 2 protein [Halomonas sp. MCCC 1A13316]
MENKVIGVILTYNRKELLKRCLKAVHSQTRPCDMVLVINNASTDGTLEYLTCGKYPDIKVYTMKKNVGAAGGFNAGFRLAYDNGADHIWMMDDDVIPDSEALEKLLQADEFLANKGMKKSYLLSTAYTELGQVCNTPQVSNARNGAGYFDWPEQLKHGLVAIGSGTFVSILVPRSTLEKYGLPISSMYIWGEDAEFTLRITQEQPGYLVGNSHVVHLRHGGGTISIVAESNPTRIGYYKNFIRNNLYISKIYKTRRRTISILFNNMFLVLKMLARKKIYKAWVITLGLAQSFGYKPKVDHVNSTYDYSSVSVSFPESDPADTEDKTRIACGGTYQQGYARSI